MVPVILCPLCSDRPADELPTEVEPVRLGALCPDCRRRLERSPPPSWSAPPLSWWRRQMLRRGCPVSSN